VKELHTLELRNELLQEFSKISSDQVLLCWSECLKTVLDYFETIDDEILVEENLDSETEE
jgi:hypothetical protein